MSNPDKMKHYNLKQLYGLSGEDFEQMLAAQNGVCAICGKPETAKGRWGKTQSLAVDHNHATGELRGLLCDRCNRGLGYYNETPERLRAAAAYLEKYQ